MGMDESEATDETQIWLSPEGSRDAIAEARAELAAGSGLTEKQIRAEFGVPKRSA